MNPGVHTIYLVFSRFVSSPIRQNIAIVTVRVYPLVIPPHDPFIIRIKNKITCPRLSSHAVLHFLWAAYLFKDLP